MKLVLFDFDGTITTQDTYTQFILTNTPIVRLLLGGLVLSPFILLNKLRLFPSPMLRPLISMLAFKGIKVADLTPKAEAFVDEYLPKVMRQDMLSQIHAHKASGDRVVIVSASLSPYLTIWCKRLGVALICSELEEKGGYFTGAYRDGDCSAKRKAIKVKNALDLDSFEQIIAYGDTKEDYAMLKLADVRYFRGKPCSANI